MGIAAEHQQLRKSAGSIAASAMGVAAVALRQVTEPQALQKPPQPVPGVPAAAAVAVAAAVAGVAAVAPLAEQAAAAGAGAAAASVGLALEAQTWLVAPSGQASKRTQSERPEGSKRVRTGYQLS